MCLSNLGQLLWLNFKNESWQQTNRELQIFLMRVKDIKLIVFQVQLLLTLSLCFFPTHLPLSSHSMITGKSKSESGLLFLSL